MESDAKVLNIIKTLISFTRSVITILNIPDEKCSSPIIEKGLPKSAGNCIRGALFLHAKTKKVRVNEGLGLVGGYSSILRLV